MIRGLLYLIVGLLLGTNVALSYAGTYTPKTEWMPSSFPSDGWFSTQTGACVAHKSHTNWQAASAGPSIVNCTYTNYLGTAGLTSGDVLSVRKSCPNGGVLSGNYCEKSCANGETLNPDGTCSASTPCGIYGGDPKATPYPNDPTQPSTCTCPAGTKWFPYGGCRATGSCSPGADPWGTTDVFVPTGGTTGCISGCEVQQNAGTFYTVKGGTYAKGSQTGWACKTTATGAADPTVADTPKIDESKIKPPVCGAGDGVMTSSSGKVLCVPEGTPNTVKPGITQEKKTETFQDGSKKDTVTTTTQDPNTTAKDVNVQVTTTAGPGGGTQAGTPGTSSSSSSTSNTSGSNGAGGSGDGGDGDCDPTLNFCGGPSTDGLYKAKTKKFDDSVKKFSDGVKGTPVGSAMTGFFNITTPSGGCPSWSVAVPVLNVQLDISQYFCTPTAINMMDLVGAVLLAIASFVAFRWAIL